MKKCIPILALCLGACSHHTASSANAVSKADTSFAAMQERGKAVMGVNQDSSTHHFVDAADGGSIQFTSNSGAAKDVEAIRTHLRTITKAFAAGDFTDPGMVHMMEVPGTAVMKEKKALIRYSYSDVESGGIVKIATSDSTALKAIHQFLEFQRTAHHTHEM